jgi:hypothetical protein
MGNKKIATFKTNAPSNRHEPRPTLRVVGSKSRASTADTHDHQRHEDRRRHGAVSRATIMISNMRWPDSVARHPRCPKGTGSG